MNTKRLLNMAAMLFLVTAFLLAFTQGGVLAVQKYLQPANIFGDGTSIGGVDVSGKTKNEAQQELVKAAEAWYGSSILDIRLAEDSQQADLNLLSFAITNSIENAKSGVKNPIGIELSEDEAETMIFSLYPGADPTEFNLSDLKDAIIAKADQLDSPLQDTINLSDFSWVNGEEETVAEVLTSGMEITPGIVTLIGAMDDIPIEGKSTFSLLQFAAELGMDELDSDDASVIASLLYELLFQTNFTVMERNQSSELPANAQLGLEAKVDGGMNLDFIFANPNDESYHLSVAEEDGGIRASLTGTPFVYGYELSLQNKESFAPKTIEQYNPALAKSETRIAEKGKDGQLISAFRIKKNHDGEVLEEEKIAEDFYPPIHRIVMRSLIVKESETAAEDPNVIDGEELRGENRKPGSTGDRDGNKDSSVKDGKDQNNQANNPVSPEGNNGDAAKPSGSNNSSPGSGSGSGNTASGQGGAGGQDKGGTSVPGQVWTDPGDVQK